MPMFEVPVTAMVEAADEQDAMSIALGDEPLRPGRYLLGRADGAVLMDRDVAAARMEFVTALNLASAQIAAGQAVEDPGHPGVRFSPMAAATMRRLRESAGED
jgi:hypothetical protein